MSELFTKALQQKLLEQVSGTIQIAVLMTSLSAPEEC